MKTASPSTKSPAASTEIKNRPLRSVDEILEENFRHAPSFGDVDHGGETEALDNEGYPSRRDIIRPLNFRDEQKEGAVSLTPEQDRMHPDIPGGIPGEELSALEEEAEKS